MTPYGFQGLRRKDNVRGNGEGRDIRAEKIHIVYMHLPDVGEYNSLLVECGLCRVTSSKSAYGKGELK